jgi:hypothetical protein
MGWTMRGQYIDFISAYCDRWCERCAFTDRCSSYAVQVALEMCDGDFEEAVELAVGAPPPRTAAEAKRREDFAAEMASIPEPTPEQMRQFEREDEAQEERIEETPLRTAAERVLLLSRQWLDDHAEALRPTAAAPVKEALEVAGWDCLFIHVKLHRAQSGADDARREGGLRRIQTDWNGSAKVALISIVRSIEAWQAIADATSDPDAAHVATELRALQREAEAAFPNAWKFHRPGFDGPLRRRWRL